MTTALIFPGQGSQAVGMGKDLAAYNAAATTTTTVPTTVASAVLVLVAIASSVASLALRDTPPEELVIAPYATLMATMVMPRAAVANLRARLVRSAPAWR